jgi:alkanesulfonate monooxygenase SsuD/methylene tetrahydromethanopterin reductase-like flavin-dependent oxidoreductase (luciferase family)
VAVAFGVPVYMGDTREEALESMRTYTFSNVTKPWRVYATVVREVCGEVPAYGKPADIPTEALATFSDALGIVGTPSECGERFADLVSETGIEHVVCRISLAGAGPMRALDALIEDVLPRVRGAK